MTAASGLQTEGTAKLISASANHLTGTIPSRIGGFRDLVELYFTEN
jgi:hypothetical protein